MTRSLEPARRRFLERRELSAQGAGEWENWLWEEIRAWLNRRITRPSPLPFYPLSIAPDAIDPGEELAREINLSCAGRTSAVEEAALQLLARWSLRIDGVEGAVVLLHFSARIGAPRLAPRLVDAVRSLLRSAPAMPPEDIEQLGLTIISAVKPRLSYEDLVELRYQIEAAGLLTPMVEAEIIASQARMQLAQLGPLVEQRLLALPERQAERAYRHIVGRLLEDFRPSEVEEAIHAIPLRKYQRPLRRALLELFGYDAEEYLSAKQPPLQFDGEVIPSSLSGLPRAA